MSFIKKKIIGIAMIVVILMSFSTVGLANSSSKMLATGDVFQRTGAGMQYDEVGVLYKGSVIEGQILGNGWIKYKKDGKDVYSYSKYFSSTSSDLKTIPSVQKNKTSNNNYVQKQQPVQSNNNSTPKQSVSNKTGKEFYMHATAYSRNEAGLGNYTANGTDLRNNPRVIAVDPRVIPLGTKVYVEGYGEAVAADTGGAIKGNKIDVHMESVNSCNSWGRKNVKVTVLE